MALLKDLARTREKVERLMAAQPGLPPRYLSAAVADEKEQPKWTEPRGTN